MGALTVEREKLEYIKETCLSMQQKLYKALEVDCGGEFNRPLLLMENPIVKQYVTRHPITLLDVCSGRIECINLKYISKMETKLMDLYRSLLKLQSAMKTIYSTKDRIRSASSIPTHRAQQRFSNNTQLPNTPAAATEILYGHVTQNLHNLADVCNLLLQLSIVVPAAPWVPLQKSFINNLTTDNVMEGLPTIGRSKQAEMRQGIDALLKAMNYSCYTSKLQSQALQEELNFHQAVYELQDDYIANLMRAIRDGHSSFLDDIRQTLCKPLNDILLSYDKMKATASEPSLREFLTVFKANAEQISNAIQILDDKSNKVKEETDESMAEYCDEYVTDLNILKNECAINRDKQISNLTEVKKQLSNYKAFIQELYPTDKTDNPQKRYKDIVTSEPDVEKESVKESDKCQHSDHINSVKPAEKTKFSKRSKSYNSLGSKSVQVDDLNNPSSSVEATKKPVIKLHANPVSSRRGEKPTLAGILKSDLKDRPEWTN